MAPTPSNVSASWRERGKTLSRASGRSIRQAVKTAICRISNLSRNDFRQGDILNVPFHVANTNPNLSPNDPHLTATMIGPAYSKSRMVAVYRVFQKHMDCVPFYTNDGRGLSHKSDQEKEEWVAVMNVGDGDSFVN